MILWMLLTSCSPDVDRSSNTSSPDLPEGSVSDVGPAPAPTGQMGRDRHRMSVAQLADSLERVTSIRWMDGEDDLFEEYSSTLGVPDWIERTHENRTADLVFNKLLEDAATEVCLELVDTEANGGTRLLVGVDLSTTVDSDRPAVEAAMSAALLRFHGHDIPMGDDRLGGWVWLFESATTVSDTRIAWQAVCTALIVHPDFYTY